MAVMWPRALPAEVLRNELRSAERKVYDRMARELDDSWVVFYSRPWLGLTSTGDEIDGECDFLVARADAGFLAIEVKGGGISYDPAKDEWTSRDRWGLRHHIKNPVHQARSSKHQLLKKLKARPFLQHRRLRIEHGVILPDGETVRAALGADMPPEIFCCRQEFEGSMKAWLSNRLGTVDASAREEPLGRDGIAALEDLLAKPFQIRIALGHVVREDDRALQLLTPNQYRILSMLDGVEKAAVGGGAGTGKTLLAIEKARRCADRGLRTLVTCFNRPLADHVGALLSDQPLIEVMTFQACCRRKADAADLQVPAGTLDTETLTNTFPELLLDAMSRRPDLGYDAVIVDEGQDFPEHWWPAVDSLLTPGGRNILYVFYDANQRVYPNTARIPASAQLIPIALNENLRNTQRIHEACRPHFTGPRTHVLGPEGVPIRWVDTAARDLRVVLDATIARCTGEDRIPPEDIGIILSSDARIKELCPKGTLGGHATAPCGKRSVGVTTVDTVRRFKGLEKPVIIVVADEALTRDRELMYVALSRARSCLIVIGTRSALDVLAAPPEV